MITRLISLLLSLVLIPGLLAGCSPGPGGGTEENSGQEVEWDSAYNGSGFSFPLLDSWQLVKESERHEVLTLRWQIPREGSSSFLIVTVVPAVLFAGDDLTDQAEKILQQSLYNVMEPVQRDVLQLEGGGTVPFLSARAGREENVASVAAVLRGSRKSAVITLVFPREHTGEYRDLLRAMVESSVLN